MFRLVYFVLVLLVSAATTQAQTEQGRFCLTYFPQAQVEAYVDSLVSYLSREMAQDDDQPLDSTTLDYIEHFASLATRKSKCVYFNVDTILVHEKVDEELTNAYLILPQANLLISRDQSGLIEQPYFIEGSSEQGYYEYEVETDRSDTKVIEGFPCYRVSVQENFFAPGEEQPRAKTYLMYVTDELKLAGGFVAGLNMSRIIGCPLEIHEPLNSKVSIAYRAAGLRLSLPEKVFQSL